MGFAASVQVVISNTLWVGESVPCLTYGMRGMIALSIEVSGPERDVHSGNDGGVFEEPMADLVGGAAACLAGRHDADFAARLCCACVHLHVQGCAVSLA